MATEPLTADEWHALAVLICEAQQAKERRRADLCAMAARGTASPDLARSCATMADRITLDLQQAQHLLARAVGMENDLRMAARIAA